MPQYLPKIYNFSPVSASIVMDYLDSEIILRKGMIQGITYPCFAIQIAEFMAKTLFFTSDLFLKAPVKRKWDPLESTCRHASLSIL